MSAPLWPRASRLVRPRCPSPPTRYGVLDVEDGNESSDFDDDNDAGAMPQFKKRASAAVASMFQLLNKVKKA